MTAGVVVIFLAGIFGLRWLSGTDLAAGLETSQPSVWLSILTALLEGVALVGSVYLLGLKRRGLSWKAAGLLPISERWLLTSITLGALAIPLAGLVAALVQMIMGQPLENPQIPFLIPEGFSWFGMTSMLVLGGIAIPFAEELFFRGVLYQWLRERFGLSVGLVGSALLFGAAHGDLAVGASAAVLGLLLGWVYERSRSLWPSVLIHVINNSVKIVLLYALVATGIDPNL